MQNKKIKLIHALTVERDVFLEIDSSFNSIEYDRAILYLQTDILPTKVFDSELLKSILIDIDAMFLCYNIKNEKNEKMDKLTKLSAQLLLESNLLFAVTEEVDYQDTTFLVSLSDAKEYLESGKIFVLRPAMQEDIDFYFKDMYVVQNS